MVFKRRIEKIFVVAVIGAALISTACSEREDPQETADIGEDVEEAPTWERPLEGQWFRGDLHVHAAGASNDASPESTHERIREVALEREMDFVVLTDHSNSTGSDPWTLDEDPDLFNQGPEFPFWDHVADLSDDSLILVQGNEISPVSDDHTEPRGHVGCIPASLDEFDPDVAFVDRPRGEVTGGEGLEQGLEVGCFTILNHPFGPVNWIAFDWTSYEYDAVEVWNGGAGYATFDEEALKGWACDLSQGRQITPVGGSDNHKINVEPPGTIADPPLGTPVTWVFGQELEWDQIIDGLYSGKVSITDTGQPLEIDVFDEDGQWLAMAGGEFEARGTAVIKLTGNRGDASGDRTLSLMRIPADACDDPREVGEINVPDPNWEILESHEISRGESFEYKFEIEAQPGDAFFAWMRPEIIISRGDDVAISGALFAK